MPSDVPFGTSTIRDLLDSDRNPNLSLGTRVRPRVNDVWLRHFLTHTVLPRLQRHQESVRRLWRGDTLVFPMLRYVQHVENPMTVEEYVEPTIICEVHVTYSNGRLHVTFSDETWAPEVVPLNHRDPAWEAIFGFSQYIQPLPETTLTFDTLRACRERMLAASGLPQTDAPVLARRIVLRNGRRDVWTLPVTLNPHGFAIARSWGVRPAVGLAMGVVKSCDEAITWDSAGMAKAPRYA